MLFVGEFPLSDNAPAAVSQMLRNGTGGVLQKTNLRRPLRGMPGKGQRRELSGKVSYPTDPQTFQDCQHSLLSVWYPADHPIRKPQDQHRTSTG
jgi:hypothetical protein